MDAHTEGARVFPPEIPPQIMPPLGSVCYLDLPFEEPRFCAKCQSEQKFVANRECDLGLVGVCLGCGDEFLRPFKRTTEAA